MSRSSWKGPYIKKTLLKDIITKNKKEITTFSRESEITPRFIGKFLKVHNGKIFILIKITEEMVGFKLGEFAPTRSKYSFKKKKNK
jgi:ribosomal protein S19